jgi:hypothetical protein
MCTTSFHPPLEKYYFASARELAKSPPTVHSNCSEAICLAVRTFLSSGLEATFLRSVIIFVKYPKVSTYTIHNMAPQMGLYQYALIKDLL